jgi:hypothetical protein
MAKKSIPDEVKAELAAIIERFNQEIGQQYRAQYVPRYRGNYLYLDRVDFMGNQSQICRLTYTGDLNSWGFAIYKFSDNRYDPDEWMIPGLGYLDGTVEGAMKAGLEVYQLQILLNPDMILSEPCRC